MKKTIVSIIMVLILITIAACGTTSKPEGTTQEAVPTSEVKLTSEPKKPITLYIQNIYSGSPTAEEFKELYGKSIQARFPHIQNIEYFSNTTRPLDQVILNKEPIDIVITSQATFHNAFIANNLQTDLTDLIAKKKYDLGRLDPSSLELIKKLGGGKLYGIPVDAGGTWVVYNKDIFDKFGVPYPPDHMTWDQFHDLSKQLSRTEGGVKYHGSAIAPVNFMIRNPYALNHLDPVTNKADFSDPKWSQFLNRIVDLYKLPGNEKDSVQLGTSGTLNLFRKDKVAAMYSPTVSNDISLISSFEGMNIGITHFPSMPGAPGGIQTYPNIYAVSSASLNKEDAFDVIAFMTSDEVQLAKSKRGTFTSLINPTIRAAFAQETPDFIKKNNLSVFTEPHKYSTPSNIVSEYTSTANGELNTALTSVITGQKDLNTAIREAMENANQKIEIAKSAKK